VCNALCTGQFYLCWRCILNGKQIFAPRVSSITAVDTSAIMIERYKTEMHGCEYMVDARVGDLMDGSEELADVGKFDLITVGAALHHFPSAEEAVKRLAMRLRAGGVLYIQDLLDGGENGEQMGKRPPGYTMEGMRRMMEGAGLVEFEFEVLMQGMEVELLSEEVLKVSCFAARGKKSTEA
jgi:SAM-dependent methyltransferase